MRKAGVPESVIMKITGHKTTAMFLRYNAVDREDAKEAMLSLEKYLAGKEKPEKSTANILQATKG